MNRFVVGASVALLLGACSSSGAAKQPDDEFIDRVESVCRDASTQILKLDPDDDGAAQDLRDLVSDAADSLNDLDPTTVFRDDFETFASTVDDEVAALGELVDDLEAGDASAAQTVVDSLGTTSDAADRLANGLGAIRCRGLIPIDELRTAVAELSGQTVPTTPDTTFDTTPDTTFDTTPDTTPDTSVATTPVTEATTPNTPLSIDTTPDTTTVATVEETIVPTDLSVAALAPAGFQWITYAPPDANGLYNNSVIGDLVVSYSAGEFQSITDAALTATVFEVELSAAFTPEYNDAYYFWEAVDEGVDVTTPSGLVVRQELGAFPDTDCAVYTLGTRGLALCVATGVDGLSLIDQYVVANPFQ